MKKLRQMIVAFGAALALTGCASEPRTEEVQPQHMADFDKLQEAVGVFHRDMRWSRFEQASLRVAPTYRSEFSGRYDELGEDFHITHLEVKRVEYDQDPKTEEARALVEVEQEWYKKPAMIIKRERFVEAWAPSSQGWQLTSRMKRDDWRAQEKARLEREGEEPKERENSEAPEDAPEGPQKIADAPPAAE